jgi:nickel/cobalt exporter
MELIGSWLSGGNIILFYAASFVLGALHALEPGHGKTVVAAYLVGSKGTITEAVTLGAVVTLTHTFSIIILAVMVKYAAASYSEEQLHIYLGFVAAALILVVGVWMMVVRWKAIHKLSHGHHDHDHHSHDEGHNGHSHDHHDHDGHSHDHAPVLEHEWEHDHVHSHGLFKHSHHNPKPGEKIGMVSLMLLGISGGIIPCPAALALLLAAVAAGAIAKGLSLVLVFSLGLAMTLIAIGIGVVKTAGFASRYMNTEKVAPYVAFASAVLITLIGVVTLYNAIMDVTAA